VRKTIRVARQRSDLWGRFPLSKARRRGQQAGRRPGTNALSEAERRLFELIDAAIGELDPIPANAATEPNARREYERNILDTFASYNDRFVDELRAQLVVSGEFAALELGRQVAAAFQRVGKAEEPLPSNAALNFRFDKLDPRAIEWAERRAGTLITNMVSSQREVFRQLVTQALATGRTPGSLGRPLVEALQQVRPGTPVAQEFVEMFGANVNGLTARYEQAVVNRSERLAGDLADRGVQPSKIVDQVRQDANKYASRLRRARARTIARTEILTANNAGRMEAYRQATEAGMLDPRTARKEWEVGPFDVCPICVELGRTTSGAPIPLDQPFQASNGWSGDAPPAHPNCRCTVEINPNPNIYSPTPLQGSGEDGDPYRFGDIRFTDA
jgi:hypothetical protein